MMAFWNGYKRWLRADRRYAPMLVMTLLLGPPVASTEPLVGEVVLYAGAYCPAGWLDADGALLSKVDYPELYAAIQDTHCNSVGGCSPGTFALPLLSGRFPRGVAPSTSAGDAGGAALTAANLPPHQHSLENVTLSGRLVASSLEGGSEVPGSAKTLGDSNRTAIYKTATPDTPLVDGSVTVSGDANALTESNASITGATERLLPPHINMRYCIASGGDTAPLIEVGLTYQENQSLPWGGVLDPVRVDVSGFTPTAGNTEDCFVDGQGNASGNLCLADLAAANPGIGRPNIRFKLVGENACTAYEVYKAPCFSYSCTSGWLLPYAAELRLTGVQVALYDPQNPPATKAEIPWGFIRDGGSIPTPSAGQGATSDFTFSLQEDEFGRGGFIAVDLIDERTLVMEVRNVSTDQYLYRIQAQCGSGDPVWYGEFSNGATGNGAYYVYYDPQIVNDGRGSNPY